MNKSSFCPGNTSVFPLWVDHGLSRCFMETLFSSLIFFLVVILGGIQVLVVWKRAMIVERRFRSTTIWFRIQIIFTFVMVMQFIIRIALLPLLGETLDGDIELSTCFYIASYIVSIFVIAVERTRVLSSDRVRGHGFILLSFWTLAFVNENLAIVSWGSPHYWWKLDTQLRQAMFGLWIVRYVLTFSLFVMGLRAPGLPNKSYTLLINEELDSSSNNNEPDSIPPENISTWVGFGKKFRYIWPYVWPKGQITLQLRVLMCVLLIVASRVIKVFGPILHRKIITTLSETGPGLPTFPIKYILLSAGCGLLTAEPFGFISNLQGLLWVRVEQYTFKGIMVRLFQHLLKLPLQWHLSRKTGEVHIVMERGAKAINYLLYQVLFTILPTLADLVIGVAYFVSAFNAWFGLIVFLAVILFIITTIAFTEWSTKFHRAVNTKDNIRKQKLVDALLNYETVKYHSNEEYEYHSYEKMNDDCQDSEMDYALANAARVFSQNSIVCGGMLVGSLLCAHLVTEHQLTAGDYVLFASYSAQLFGPLPRFGVYYRKLQVSFIDLENMIDLLDEKPDIADDPKAADLIFKEGRVDFENVDFHYHELKPVLKNISFTVEAGKSVAIVGPSGSGKSTITRLLYRLLNPHKGCITLDGQDISKVSLSSLRNVIGVVPQDTVLFNNDIRYNIRYAKMNSPMPEVEDAAKVAGVHDRIQLKPQGYDTIVGERGLALSGGEKQRVAIARTILKAPDIVILDEATSALDRTTERNIQASLASVCENRTTIIVTHRLSTITNVDQILVLQDGAIVERGRHEELLATNGLYADMWQHPLEEQGVKGANHVKEICPFFGICEDEGHQKNT